MKEKSKSTSKAAKVEKQVQEIFRQRTESLHELGLSTRVPKQPHFMSLKTKKA